MADSVVIVTCASSGIGEATALRLARDFGAVVLAARGGGKLAEVGQQVEASGAKTLALELDLMAPTAAEAGLHHDRLRGWRGSGRGSDRHGRGVAVHEAA